MIARVLALLVFFGFAAGAAGAQTESPAAAAAGFSARAHLTIAFAMRGAKQSVAVRVAITQRNDLTRVDLVAFEVPGLSIKTAPMTFVIDRRANTITAWNDTTHVYYTQSFLPRSLGGGAAQPSPAPSSTTAPDTRPARSVLAGLDLLTMDVRLTGHSVVGGIASTGLKLNAKIRRHGATAVSHVTASMAVADDFAFFPVALQAQLVGTGPSAGPSLTYAVDAFSRDVPAASGFALPDGYALATSLLRVVMGPAPRRASPLPAASPTAASATATPAGVPL